MSNVIMGVGQGGSWSAERFLKMAWSLERRPQKGLERGAPKFPFLVGAPKFSKTCRSISKKKRKRKKKKDIRACGARKIHVEMVERGAKK